MTETDPTAAGAAPADPAVAAAGDPTGGVTGDPAVDEALGRLRALDGAPVHEHVAVFEAVHAALQGRLADVED
ncbi:hypothetical protein [uncultured Cellulomonas sp.]|uniref:hypothetical protein n=1 Tax=uncultured Cellulomonas sp. TaxID=189682 RepID=UPI00262958DB|nr:hypothetical protein [uncultured Cellulomonas sp.]